MSLTSLSPLDGRYESKVQELQQYFSEEALIRFRVVVEIRFLIALSKEKKIKEVREFTKKEHEFLNDLSRNFSVQDAQKVKTIEKKTNHDVKAVEYFIKENLGKTSLKNVIEFVHFACTSEDINNLAYGLMLKEGIKEVIMPTLRQIYADLDDIAKVNAKLPMLARTHGQPASPTTLGKEFKVFAERIARQIWLLESQQYLGKLNGATGNFNAHLIAYPEIDWLNFSKNFVEGLGLCWNKYTVQIEPHDYMAEVLNKIILVNTILIDFSRDIWGYVSLGFFKQKLKKGEVGSSTMPHKVNPIDFENAEGNLGLANSVMNHLSKKLPVSRWQRDLTDSTVLRNLGVGFGYSLLAYKSLQKGISKLKVNQNNIQVDLNNNWEVLAEAIQTVMRKNGIKKPYEKLKELTRGKKIGQKEIQDFVNKLKLPENEKKILMKLTPETYIGLGKELAS